MKTLIKIFLVLFPFFGFAQLGTGLYGKVGINVGTTAPTERLKVNGASYFNGVMRVGNILNVEDSLNNKQSIRTDILLPNLSSTPASVSGKIKLFSNENGFPSWTDSDNNVNVIQSEFVDFPKLKRKIQNTVNGIGVNQIKWLTWGDSMAMTKSKHIFNTLDDLAGYSGGFNAGNYGGTTNNTGSTITTVQDYNVFPFTFIQIAQGNSHIIGIGGVTATIDRVKFYLLNNGATYTLQINDANVSGHTSVTLPSNNGVTIVSVSPTLASNKVALLAVTGNVKELSNGLWNSTVSGFIPINLSEGGNDMSSWIGNAQALSNLNTIIADINPDVISYEMKETVSGFPARLETLLNSFQTNAANAEILMFTTTPTASGNLDMIANNNEVYKQARKRVFPLYDTYKYAVNYAKLVENSWQGDGVHPSDEFQKSAANDFLKKFRLIDFSNSSGLVSSTDINYSRVFTSGIKDTQYRAEFLVEPTFRNAGIIQARNNITLRNNNNTRSISFDVGDGTNGADGTQSIFPQFFRVGAGNQRFYSNSTAMYILDNTTSNNTTTALGGLITKGLVYQDLYTSGNNITTYNNSGYTTSKVFGASGNIVIGKSNFVGTLSDDPSTILKIDSDNQGILIPRMTATKRDLITNKAAWLQIICTDCTATDGSTGVLQIWNGSVWKNAY